MCAGFVFDPLVLRMELAEINLPLLVKAVMRAFWRWILFALLLGEHDDRNSRMWRSLSFVFCLLVK